MKRDRFQCTYCGVAGTDAELEIDHIVPVSKGGSHHISNLTTACRACNQEKSDGPAPRRKASGDRGVIGMFLHTFEGGVVQFTGEIIGREDDFFLVQLFSALCGSPTNVIPIHRNRLFSNQVKLYATVESLEYCYEVVERKKLERHCREKYKQQQAEPKLSGEEMADILDASRFNPDFEPS